MVLDVTLVNTQYYKVRIKGKLKKEPLFRSQLRSPILNWQIGQVGRVFAKSLVDLGSISGRVIPNTLKVVLETSLLNTEQYKVRIKGKVEQSRERSSASYTSVS